MKKVLVCINMLAFMFLLAMCPTHVMAANLSGDWEYTISQGVVTITEYNGSASKVIIPGTLGGYPVVKIGKSVFEDRIFMTEITFPNSLKEIGLYAFSGCKKLSSITLPKDLTKVSGFAFSDCVALTKITVNSKNLESTSTTFANAGKESANGIQVIFSDEVKVIPDSMFGCDLYQYAHVKSVEVGKNVEIIGRYAFENCQKLEKITFPNSLKEIGLYAFSGCKKLSSITLPKDLAKVSGFAFSDCVALTKITVNSKNLESTSTTFANAGKESANGIQVIFSDEVKVIPDSMFGCDSYQYAHVKSVELGKNVERIGEYAFENCQKLEQIKINNYGALKEIEGYAFSECTNLRGVVIPANVESVGYNAFYNCTSMKKMDVLSTKCELKNAKNTLGIPGTTVIYGYSGTTAETYANRYGYTFSVVKIPFRDIRINDYYFTPVMWAVEENITSGLNAVQFAPNDTCTRGQVVTFLWRTMGSPSPKTTRNPFQDVKSSAYYYKAVLWAVENGITSGLNGTTFGPESACSRAQVATFLWRTLKCPNPTTSRAPFQDVKSNAYYYKAVLWAMENGVTAGLDATHFAPDETCTRGQIVTFLYRAFV